MKRSEILFKLQKYYNTRHVMVEGGYITPDNFMTEVLSLVEELGMQPPANNLEDFSGGFNPPNYYVNEWEDEE